MLSAGLGVALSPASAAATHPAAVRAGAAMAVQDPKDGNFVPLPQATLVDTRNGTGLPKAPINGGTTHNFAVLGQSGVPSTGVTAVALTVTTTASTSSSQLIMWPTGATRPGTVTTVSSPGDNRQNSAYVATGTGGDVSVYIDHDSTHLIVSVTGYFSSADASSGFNPVAQKRVVDTANGTGVPQAQIGAGKSVTFSVAAAGVPTSATAVAFNFTTTSTGNGYLNAGPASGGSSTNTGISFAGGSDPWSSTAFVQVTSARSITITNGASVAITLTVDLFGYFAASDAGGGFTPTQSRIYDSANSSPVNIAANATAFIPVLGRVGSRPSWSGRSRSS